MSERNGGNPVRAAGAPAGTQSVPFGPALPLRARSTRNPWGKLGIPDRPSVTTRLPRLRFVLPVPTEPANGTSTSPESAA